MIRKFETKDWHAIDDPIEPCDIDIDKAMIDLAERSLAITVENSKGVLGCGGVILYNDTEGELWLKLSKKANKLSVIEAVTTGLKILIESFDGVTFYCRVRQGFEKGEKLVKWLGFKLNRIQDGYGVYIWQ